MTRTKNKNRNNRTRSKERSARPAGFHNRFYVTPQRHSEKGMIAFGISLGMIAVFILLVAVAAMCAGNLPVWYGSLGVLAMIGSFISLVLALQSRRERQSFKLFPNLAAASSVIACLLWVFTYGMGMAG